MTKIEMLLANLDRLGNDFMQLFYPCSIVFYIFYFRICYVALAAVPGSTLILLFFMFYFPICQVPLAVVAVSTFILLLFIFYFPICQVPLAVVAVSTFILMLFYILFSYLLSTSCSISQ